MGLEKPEYLKMRVDARKLAENGQNTRQNAFFGQNLMKSPEKSNSVRKWGHKSKK